MKKIITAIVLGLGLAVASGAAAQATTPEEHYLLFAWEITSNDPGNHFKTPQDYVAHVETTSQSLDQHDLAIFLPGRCYQLDLYLDNEQSRALIGAQLFGPGNPHEPWPGGQYQSSFSRVFCMPDAVQPPDERYEGSAKVVDCEAGTITVSSWFEIVTYVGDKYGYTAQPPVRTNNPDVVTATTEADCQLPPPPVDEPLCGTPTTLACSGVAEDAPLWAGGALAGILAGIGIARRRQIATLLDRLYFRA